MAMKFKPGDKVWAIAYPEAGPPRIPAAGEYAGTVMEFLQRADSPVGPVEIYAVDIPSMPAPDGDFWVITHLCLRPRDDPDDMPGDSDAEPYKPAEWGEIWNPTKLLTPTS